MRKLRLPVLLAAVVALVFAAIALGSPAQKQAPQLKVALIAPSAHNDLAFTQSMYAALQSLKTKYNLDISVSENQFVVADAANIIRQYAEQGYDLVIAHGSQYGGTIQQLAPLFPKVSFAWGTAGDTFNQPNVYAYEAASDQGGYVQGYVAALLSKSKVLGVIGPIAVGDAKLYVDGFVAGAKAALKRVKVNVAYTGSFSDPSLMSKQATQFLAQKADVLTGSSQSVVGAITVAKTKNVAWFGTQWLQTSLAPKQVVSSQVYDWTGMLGQILKRIQNNQLGGQSYVITLKNGGEKVQFNRGYKLPPTVKAAAAKVIAGISSGKIVVPKPAA
ncbi:MAG TPA: BMP family protein [Gaiellaceae bacterium]